VEEQERKGEAEILKRCMNSTKALVLFLAPCLIAVAFQVFTGK
jgi:hypothetical protein